MKKLTILFLFTVGVIQYTTAQFGSNVGQPVIGVDNLIPKSPQSEQLTRINEISIDASRGAPNISFTLYTASVGNLKIPISISYDATGIRYDDIPSSVGLKWTLMAGGEISRSINGRPDESGYFTDASEYTESYFAGLNTGTDSAQSLLSGIANNETDISQDQYNYNYLDRSGYFYYRNNQFLDCKNPFTNKIECDTLWGLPSLRIRDDEGNLAYFGNAYTDITVASYGGSGYITPNIPSQGLTAWKLYQLKTYSKEIATFEYDTCVYETSKILSQSYTFRHWVWDGFDTYNCNCGTSSFNESDLTTSYTIYLPTKIHTPNEDVQFYYSVDNTLSIYKKRLDSITVKDKVNQNVIKRIHFKYGSYSTVNLLRLDEIWDFSTTGNDSLLIASFHYNNGALAGISSNARDVFNYNNGASNSYLISSSDADYPSSVYGNATRTIGSAIINGVLDTVYYPTGGKTAFSYSANNPASGSYGPGIKVDSIKYINKDNSIVSSTQFKYAGGSGQGWHFYTSYIDNTTYNNDNTNCPVKTFNSELPNNSPPIQPFYYDSVEIRQVSTISGQTELTKEIYGNYMDCYNINRPILSKKIYFRNNSLTDTLKVETYTYASNGHIDSLGMDWLYPGNSYLPSRYYYLDGIEYDNINNCDVLYYGIGSYGTIEPRTNLITKVDTKDFDQDNNSRTITSTANSGYNSNWQRVYDTKINSKGNLDSVYYTYLHTNPGSLSSNISNDNLYALVNKTTRYASGTQMEQSRVSFSSHSGTVLPDSFFVKSQSNSEIFNNMITGYDTLNRITEVNSKAGFYTAVLRDYNNQFIVAEVSNAKLSQIAYTSFEAESKGGWSFSGSTTSDASSPTGSKCYNLSGGNITKSSLTSATYIVSYWSKSGAYTVNGSSTPTRTGKTIGSWTYYEHEVTGTSITISGSNYIDEVRLLPKGGAKMTTYTYTPLVGISSICDPDGRISYYQYDSFGRLKLIEDQDKNVIKVYDYKYQQAQNQ